MIRLTTLGLMLAVAAVAYLTLAFLMQRSALFPMPGAAPRSPPGTAEVVALHQVAGVVEALFLAPRTGSGAPAPLLVFFHGNAELADDWVEPFAVPRSWGWAVLLVEYPGYGRSAGRPSEASVMAAAVAAHDWAVADPRIDSQRIVAYGRSLGGGAAARLAHERSVAGVILESSFTSVAAMARRFLVPRWLVRDRFDTLEALSDYVGPLLVIHGRRDTIIPVAHGRTLAAAVPGAEFHEVACGHNDCPRPWVEIKAFLDRIPDPGR